MKKMTTLSLIALILFSCANKTISDTPEKFGKSIIECFENDDFNSFKELIINEKDFEYLMENTDFPSKEDKDKVISTKNERIKSLREQNKTLFDNCNYKNLKYISSIYTVKKDGAVEYISNYQIHTKSSDKELKISFQRLVKTKNGWKSVGNFTVE